jgi:hypothetical protein
LSSVSPTTKRGRSSRFNSLPDGVCRRLSKTTRLGTLKSAIAPAPDDGLLVELFAGLDNDDRGHRLDPARVAQAHHRDLETTGIL